MQAKKATTNYDKQLIKCRSHTAYTISKLKCLIIHYILAMQKCAEFPRPFICPNYLFLTQLHLYNTREH